MDVIVTFVIPALCDLEVDVSATDEAVVNEDTAAAMLDVNLCGEDGDVKFV